MQRPALQQLAAQAPQWWRHWNPSAIRHACAQAEADAPADPPPALLLVWRAMAAFMDEQADALARLDAAHAACTAAGDTTRVAATVHLALVFALLDVGAMREVRTWLARWDGLAAAPDAPSTAPAKAAPPATAAADADTSVWLSAAPGLWSQLAPLAAVALGGQGQGQDSAAAAALLHGLQQGEGPLSPGERLITAHVLAEYLFIQQRLDSFDFLANAVEVPALFEAAPALLRARWLFTYGYTQHHTGRPAQAEQAWQRALAIAQANGLSFMALKTTLALARGLLTSGRTDQAQAIIDSVQPQWGAGRTAQLMELLQLRARVQLLRGRAAAALSLLQDALQAGEAAGLPRSECAACWSDLIQTYVALGRIAEAQALLERQAAEQQGRDALVSQCQALLLRASMLADDDPVACRQALAAGLAIAEQTRYTMFFRLLPALAASLCALALRWQLAPAFVTELVGARALPAPADAGPAWPWPLWLRLLGSAELHQRGALQLPGGKTPHKPLELLRLLACQRTLRISLPAAMDAVWPEADALSARRSFDMAVHRLRPLLGDATLLWVADGQVGLDATRVASDVQQRRALIDRIAALAMGRPGDAGAVAPCQALVAQVMALTGGELLPCMPGTAWVQAARRACGADTVRAALAAASVLQQAGPAQATTPAPLDDAALALLEAALRIEPLSESLVQRLVQAHQRAGRPGDAQRVADNHRRALAASSGG